MQALTNCAKSNFILFMPLTYPSILYRYLTKLTCLLMCTPHITKAPDLASFVRLLLDGVRVGVCTIRKAGGLETRDKNRFHLYEILGIEL